MALATCTSCQSNESLPTLTLDCETSGELLEERDAYAQPSLERDARIRTLLGEVEFYAVDTGLKFDLPIVLGFSVTDDELQVNAHGTPAELAQLSDGTRCCERSTASANWR